jgi:hypothetical protein
MQRMEHQKGPLADWVRSLLMRRSLCLGEQAGAHRLGVGFRRETYHGFRVELEPVGVGQSDFGSQFWTGIDTYNQQYASGHPVLRN